ncbi:hypothetical protein BUALT_Bualt12G0054800 [Buddleja alternifolia]|uniref:F-box domain-containing protein n=1 Tax=Buddleja alternifolia TaxID=168488 RepID=A0AAV6WNM2_9LAMI|nr:hypothetical protein BUALT_Bualt12G0054800 [Buddleja alternifolia]
MDCNISSSSPISPAAIVAGNYDVLTEILILIPSKSLIRFQSVSKHWQSLIFNEFFTRRHTFRHFRRRWRQPQPSFLLRATTSQFFYFQPSITKLVPFYFNNFGNINILQSCNGLLLLECGDSDIPHSSKDYYVFNPTTMKSRNLSLDISYRSRKNILGFCLKFDPSKSNHYMVYCLRSRSKPNRGYCVAVYNSRTHEWKRWWHLSISGSGLYWYKSIYWIQPQATLFCFSTPQCGGEYSIYKPPTIQFPGIRKEYVFESNGRMCCAILSLHPDKNNLFLYRMLTNSWSRMCRVKFDPTPVTFLEKNLPNISILGTIKGEFAGKHSALLFHVPGKIMVHQLYKSDTSEVLIDFSREEYYEEGLLLFESEDAHQFIETLAPV